MVNLLQSFLTWPFLVKVMILDLSGLIDRLHPLQKSLTLHTCFVIELRMLIKVVNHQHITNDLF